MSTTSETTSLPWKQPVWFLVTCGSLIVLLSMGFRSAMGLFQLPMLGDLGWGRSTFALALALQNLAWGIGQPFFGSLADRRGPWLVLAIGAILWSAGLYLMSGVDSPLMLHLSGGILIGLGIAATSYGVIFSVLARNVAQENHTMVFGIGTAAGSLGMFILSPVSVGMIDHFGWSDTLVIFAIVMMVIPFLGLALINRSGNQVNDSDQLAQTVGEALKEAFGHKPYVYLTTGFFVCGFQLAFITVHFPAYIQDIGVDAKYAGYALAMIGLFNVAGSLASGVLGQKYSKPLLLGWIYIARSVVILGFILLPQSATTVIIFSMLMGLLWLSTVAPTNALVAVMFGTKHLGLLGGFVFVSHQVGSFLGVWLGGVLYDVYGNFDLVWWIAIVLGLFAAAVHWPIPEKAVVREATA